MLAHGGVALLLFAFTLLGGLFPVTVLGTSSTPRLQAAAISMPGLVASAPLTVVSSLEAAPVPLTVVAPAVSQENVLRVSDSTVATVSTILQAQRQSSVAAGETLSAREPARVPLYYRHEVKEGETIASIAGDFGLESRYIEWNNADVIDDANLLSVGQVLQIPSVPGIIHGVRAEETLTEIADQYAAAAQDIIDFPANGLADPNQLREGALILVVNGRRLPPPAPTLRPVVSEPAFVGEREASAFGFTWPLLGPITSFFGPAHPLGIDISAPYIPVAAPAAGQVVFAGGDSCCSYGLYVEIDHGSGYETLYAHLSNINVSIGEWVEQGQIIGTSGSTGRSTGPHLHFEVKRNGVTQNPMLFLP